MPEYRSGEVNMRKCGLSILALAAITLLLCLCLACGSRIELGQEFSLSIGQSAIIADEDLEITFEEITEDSRCPRDVVCIWEGRIVCSAKFTEGENAYDIELTQPGLSDEYTQEVYRGYQFTFRVEPYPEADQVILDSEYRLLLTITK
jgi:hypothetical protein